MYESSVLFKILAGAAQWYECAPGAVDPAAEECHITGLTGTEGTTLYTLARYDSRTLVLCYSLLGQTGWKRIACDDHVLSALRRKMKISAGIVDAEE